MTDNKDITILIVEDNEDMRVLLYNVLSKEGFEIIQAENGNDALSQLEKNKNISLVISDIKMPECNGIDMLCKTVQKHPGLPVILITAFGDVEQYLDAMNLGAFEYLNKPFKNQDLLDVVKRVVKKIKKAK